MINSVRDVGFNLQRNPNLRAFDARQRLSHP
jgi:hypothetical protein